MACVVVASGCGFDPGAIPVPGSGVSGSTYDVRIEFTNVLNLPSRAKVVANGAVVGSVTGIDLVQDSAGGYVTVRAEIMDSVRLPVSTVAEMRQSTVLGDSFIALTTPPSGFGELLAPGGRIPLNQTVPPIQIEDAMAGFATFVQGGAITRFQDIVNQLNGVLPRDPKETARIADVLGGDARDLAANLDRVDSFLSGIEQTVGVVHERAPVLHEQLAPAAVEQTSGAVQTLVATIGIIGALGDVAHALIWLTPLVASGDAAASALVPLFLTTRPLDLDAPSNLNALVKLLREKIIPFVEHGPKVNVRSVRIEGADAVPVDAQVEQIIRALRMVGVVR
ncbi:MCE family protein [Nocardia sp. NEAU-351]|uniref:MCE family protein n=1 Tax=Nocardia bovistercoris TaxID=2785916 RepID=A0A931I8W1_9NOCA|nr:MCE family protein [Nocardia bovistercoris]